MIMELLLLLWLQAIIVDVRWCIEYIHYLFVFFNLFSGFVRMLFNSIHYDDVSSRVSLSAQRLLQRVKSARSIDLKANVDDRHISFRCVLPTLPVDDDDVPWMMWRAQHHTHTFYLEHIFVVVRTHYVTCIYGFELSIRVCVMMFAESTAHHHSHASLVRPIDHRRPTTCEHTTTKTTAT